MPESQSKRRACLGMPGYGNLTAGAALGFFQATGGAVSIDGQQVSLAVDRTYNDGSLLAQNFNALWCWALNEDRKSKIDYFAMLHSDVEPERRWLDSLIEEMEARNLDVLGVVVPLKCPNGLTSVALDRPDGNSWRPQCRLTMKEVYDLPETFTQDDVGYRVLLNTGCWVCRFDSEWASKVHFTINDRIVFDSQRQSYVAEVEPEDWYFSRRCHELGLRIGATRKVKLNHAGSVRYTNTYAWGEKTFDTEYVPESVVIQLTVRQPSNGFAFPHDVDGWLTQREGLALAELARGKSVLEIGSYCGKSTICLAQTAEAVMSIDPHDGRGTPRPRNTKDEFLANLARYGVDQKVNSARALTDIAIPEYDLIFIDGAHDYESVSSDIQKSLEKLAAGGLIAFHDYREHPGQYDGRWDEGVTQAVNEFLSAGAELVSTHDSLAVVRPPAAIPLEV
jgi:predicted O-methyltransferase YrrM